MRSAVWARAGVVYNPANDRIYFATGNGPFDPANYHWGDTVLAIAPDGSSAGGRPLDSYTPENYQQLQDVDADLGSTNVALLPAAAGHAPAHLGLQGGKVEQNGAAMLRLLNLDNLSGQGGPGHVGGQVAAPLPVPQGGEILTTPAVWTNPATGATWVFVATDQGISGLELVWDGAGQPSLQTRWQHASGYAFSPLVANNVLYYAGGNTVHALRPADGTELWSDQGLGGIHWESPVVANGTLYITDEAGQLTAYAPAGR